MQPRAPKGRQNIAQDVSPGENVRIRNAAPEGRQSRCKPSVSVAPSGLEKWQTGSQGLRPGLYSDAPSGLEARKAFRLSSERIE